MSNVKNSSAKRKKSIYWNFFTKSEEHSTHSISKANCNVCDCIVSLVAIGKSANTSNLKYQVEKVYPEGLQKMQVQAKAAQPSTSTQGKFYAGSLHVSFLYTIEIIN